MSNQCVTGLLREYGQDIPLKFTTNYLHCPYRGGVHDPTYRFLQSLPTDPHALLSLIEQQMQGQLPRPEEAFTTIGDLLGEAIAPPQVSAALYRAAALIPGVTVVRERDRCDRPPRRRGRHDTRPGLRTEWIFSKHTFATSANAPSTPPTARQRRSAVLQRDFVNRAGQIPG